jgi:predicted transposase YbfD/YdcC
MRTVIKVSRQREEVKTGKKSQEESYYVSNEVGKYEQLSEAIRKHWQVETANHIRDCTLKEDKLRSKKSVLIE